MGNTLSEQLLKRKYDNSSKVENAGLVATAFLKKVSRITNPSGDSYTTFLTISGGVGWAGSRAGAQAIAGQGGTRGNGAWQSIKNSRGQLKGEVTVEEQEIKRANSGDASALRALAAHSDTHLAHWGQFTEAMVFGHRGLYLSTGTISSGVVTLAGADSSPEHITRFKKDMLIVASAANGTSGTLLGAGSIGYLIGIARSGASPTFTVSTTSGGAAGTPAGWTGTMYFFVYETWYGTGGVGGGQDNGVDRGFAIDTLDSWVPSAAPSATLFKTMDRTVDDLLGGIRLSAGEVANLNIAQRIEALAVLGRSRYGWNDAKKIAYVHTITFNKLSQLLQRADVRQAGYGMKDAGKGEYGYKYIEMTSIGADVRVEECPVADPFTVWMLDPDDWELHSDAGFPSVMDEDGLRWVRDRSNDTFALQYTSYHSLYTKNPARTARCPAN